MSRYLFYFMLFAALLPGMASAGLKDRLTAVQEYLDAGKGDKAVELLRELQTDYPDSPLVAYSMGMAQYKRAAQQLDLGAADEAAAAYGEARSAFESAVAKAKEPALAREAAFALSNAIARRAMAIPAQEKRAEAIGAFKEAVNSYESLLEKYPDMASARKNLDNVQYQLKQLLQQPESKSPEDKKEQPPQEPKQATVYFIESGTELPNATTKNEGNQLELVMPDKAQEAKP